MDLRSAARAALAGTLSESELEALWTRAAARPRPMPGAPRKHLGHAQQARTRRPEPERARRRERRRRVAAGGWLPPTLAASFTPGEAAVMSVIGCEVMLRGRCELTNGELADLAGVGRTTVLRALRQAVRLGLLDRQERRIAVDRNLPNILTIMDLRWVSWLRLRRSRGVGAKGRAPDDRISISEAIEALSATRETTEIHRKAISKPAEAHLDRKQKRPRVD